MGGLGLDTIRAGVRFAPDPAAAFRRANAQVRAEFRRDIDVNRTTVEWSTQLGMFNAWNRYAASGFKPALYPGHSKAVHPSESFHVFDPNTGKGGNALDSDDWVNARIVAILAENGFIRNRLYVKGEEHHFEWLRNRDKNYGAPILAGGGSTPNREEDDMYDANAEKRLMERLDELARIAAPLKLYTYGSGIIAVNPLTRAWMILGPGYPELLNHLGLAAGQSKLVDDAQFRYATQYVPDAVGAKPIGEADGFTDADLAEIKAAIEKNRVALTQAQLDALTDAVAAGAREGGEEGAKAAIADLTFVVRAG